MKKLIVLLVGLVSLVMFSGCTTPLLVNFHQPISGYSYDQVFDAAVYTFTNNGEDVVDANRSAGTIRTSMKDSYTLNLNIGTGNSITIPPVDNFYTITKSRKGTIYYSISAKIAIYPPQAYLWPNKTELSPTPPYEEQEWRKY